MTAPRQWNSRRRSELPADWARIRRRVLKRDFGLCVMCGGPANQVDHIGDRDNHSDDNLRSLCTPHHQSRTSAQGVAVRQARVKAKFRPQERHPSERG
jgi:5-methylcytosine-specific restriction protein A